MSGPRASLRLGSLEEPYWEALAELVGDPGEAGRDAVRRLWTQDHTLWSADPTDISNRLGWLNGPERYGWQTSEYVRFAARVRADGFERVLVLGMGGSSLFPEVVSRCFEPSGIPVGVLDSTHPDVVARVTGALPLDRTLFIVSSKSGTTSETLSHLAHFWKAVALGDGSASSFCAITDPGSSLSAFATEHAFRRVFENDPNIGGRFSALSLFGLIPAVLHGADIDALIDSAKSEAGFSGSCDRPDENIALVLGAVLGAAARSRRDKLTLVLPPPLEPLGVWIEQLVSESLGKFGRGLIPIVGEIPGSVDVYGDDRLFVGAAESAFLDDMAGAGHPVVNLPFGSVEDLGAAVFAWEIATALAGALLKVNPFDQPDVEATKKATRGLLEQEEIDEPDVEPLDDLLERVRPGDYVALQIFGDPESEELRDIAATASRIRDEHKVAVTVGFGPRFLHSTGQLHKGGPTSGVFVQALQPPEQDFDVPDRGHTFEELMRAQAAGDLMTLKEKGRRAGRVDIAELAAR